MRKIHDMKKRVDVRDLSFGMYIAELDRPWLETPFLFQGFELRNPDELEQLKQHCQYVYIDTEQGPDLPELRGKRALPARTKIVRADEERLKREFRVLLESPEKEGGTFAERKRSAYQDQSTLEEEIEEAKQIDSEARDVMAQALDDVRQGKPLDAARAKKVIVITSYSIHYTKLYDSFAPVLLAD